LQINTEGLIAGVSSSGFIKLLITATHGALAANLPEHHHNPFDRMLITASHDRTVKITDREWIATPVLRVC